LLPSVVGFFEYWLWYSDIFSRQSHIFWYTSFTTRMLHFFPLSRQSHIFSSVPVAVRNTVPFTLILLRPVPIDFTRSGLFRGICFFVHRRPRSLMNHSIVPSFLLGFRISLGSYCVSLERSGHAQSDETLRWVHGMDLYKCSSFTPSQLMGGAMAALCVWLCLCHCVLRPEPCTANGRSCTFSSF
jgi:hypothetical protein